MLTSLSSEELEVFGDALRDINFALGKLKGAEVTKADIKEAAADLARRWIRHSQELQERGVVSGEVLRKYDDAMVEILNATKVRARASSYQSKLAPFIDSFNDEVVVPAIKYEGNPEQAAARQLLSTLRPNLNSDEIEYVEEAARCASMRCYRATLVLLWAAGIARLHQAIERLGFDSYNAAMTAASAKSKNPFNRLQKGSITSLPELQRLRDFDLLVVGMVLWGYDLQAFQEMERLLGQRNTAAHPGMYAPGALDIQQFAAKLNQHIFTVIGR